MPTQEIDKKEDYSLLATDREIFLEKDRGKRSGGKFGPEVCGHVIEALERGAHFDVACAYADIKPANLRKWLVKGRDKESGEYHEFYLAIRRALAKSEMSLVRLIERQAEGYTVKRTTTTTYADGSKKIVEDEIPVREWTAAAWMLERRFPQRWGRKIHTQEGATNRQSLAVAVYIPSNFRDEPSKSPKKTKEIPTTTGES
jgi:hypothetical protein